MLSRKKPRQTRRHICTCSAHDCFDGRFIDANGKPCHGVELSPEAFEAHRRSEIRHQAQASAKSKNSSQVSSTTLQKVAATEQDLVTQLEQVVLGPSQPSRSSNVAPGDFSHDQLPTTESSARGRSTPAVQANTSNSHDQTETENITSKHLITTVRARENGVEAYNCGTSSCYEYW